MLFVDVSIRYTVQAYKKEYGSYVIFKYLHTSLALENLEFLMTSGAIQAYVPALLMFADWLTSRARPKSVIFSVTLCKISPSPIGSFSRTETTESVNVHAVGT